MNNKNKRIVFMGTPDFAVASLKALIDEGFEVALVVTQPDRPSGRGRVLSACPVKTFALENALEVVCPTRLGDETFLARLRAVKPDVIVVVAYGRILPKEVLEIPPGGCINLHSSLLPAYRGAAPINWAVINCESMTGVTTMFMDSGLDTGPVLLRRKTLISVGENALDLSRRLSKLGADLLVETLHNLATINAQAQDDSIATYAPILKKQDGRIDWNTHALRVDCLVRGLTPWPGAVTAYNGKTIKVHKGEPHEAVGGARVTSPGTVVSTESSRILVACAKGTYDIIELQMENKQRMTSAQFLCGLRLKEGDLLGWV